MTLATVDHFDRAAVLKTLNLNPADPHTQALLLICERYRLDPLLKHIVLIQGRPYVTRDGYLAIAHASGQFDGIEILEEGETPTHWWARAAVYRKDMGRPFTYRGRHPKKGGGNAQYGPEMAVKTAEVTALRRAFNVTGVEACDTGEPPPDLDEPVTLPAKDAKAHLLEWADGNKTFAAAAWQAAGLSGRRTVTEAELASAYAELPATGTAADTGDTDPDPDEAA